MRKLLSLLWIVFISYLIGGPPPWWSPRESLNIRIVGAWTADIARAVCPISHNIVYLGVGHGIWIYNTSNPREVIKIGEISFVEGSCIREMVKKDNLLLISHSYEGFSILDISEVSQPRRLSFVSINGINDIAVEGDYLYITDGDTFFIYNISNPQMPLRISATPFYPTTYRKQNIFINENRAYLSLSWVGLLIYDISNPSRPILLGRWDVSYLEEIDGIWVKDTLCFLAMDDSLKILSVANPRNIYPIGIYRLPSEYGFQDVWVKDSFCYLPNIEELHIIKISNPRFPSFVSRCQIGGIEKVVILDSLVYGQCWHSLKIVNIKNPYQPQLIGSSDFVCGWILRGEVINNFAILTCTEGIWVIDFSDSSRPREFSKLPLFGSWLYDLAIKDSFLYTSHINCSLLVINIANLSSMRKIYSTPICWARALFIKDSFLYMAHAQMNEWTTGLSIWNISNPNYPVLLGSVENEDADAYGLFVKDDYAYVGDGSWDRGEDYGGFRIYNIGNPRFPYQVYHFIPNFISSGATNEIFIRGNTAFVCDDAGLFIFDVSIPTNPRLITYYTNFRGYDIFIEGNLAYLASGYFGIRVLDISDILNIRQVAYYRIMGYVEKVIVRGKYIFAFLDYGGFYIFEYYNPNIKEKANYKLKSDLELKGKKLSVNLEGESSKLAVIDILGRVKKRLIINKHIDLDLSSFPSGIYFIHFQKGKERLFKKIILH
jgi:hypothetical protein